MKPKELKTAKELIEQEIRYWKQKLTLNQNLVKKMFLPCEYNNEGKRIKQIIKIYKAILKLNYDVEIIAFIRNLNNVLKKVKGDI